MNLDWFLQYSLPSFGSDGFNVLWPMDGFQFVLLRLVVCSVNDNCLIGYQQDVPTNSSLGVSQPHSISGLCDTW